VDTNATAIRRPRRITRKPRNDVATELRVAVPVDKNTLTVSERRVHGFGPYNAQRISRGAGRGARGVAQRA